MYKAMRVFFGQGSRGRHRLAATLLALALPASAAPTLLDATTSLHVFDQGGVLDYAENGGHVGGIEAVAADTVYVVVDTPSLGVLTTSLQLLRSTGPGTAEFVGPPQPLVIMPWASDLTVGPDGWLYVAGALDGTGGIFGLDPGGSAPPRIFAQASCAFSTTGLTFDPQGAYALVSTDGSQTSCGNGLFQVWPDGTTQHLVEQLEVPLGIPRGVDDHAVLPDGRIVLAGDKSHDLWDATAGAGAITVAIDLDLAFAPDAIPGWVGTNPVFGSRIAVDPVTGDMFYSHGSGAPEKEISIVRVASDFGSATIFAEGFSILRDLDFGPPAADNARSLFVMVLERGSQVPSAEDVGIVYEIRFPADTDADGVADDRDNCTLHPNPAQRDTDGDGFGNRCDPDLDGNGVVNVVDLGLLKAVFFAAGDNDADFDGDGVVNAVDLGIMKTFFFGPPGPGGGSP